MNDKQIVKEEITLFGRVTCDWCARFDGVSLYRVQVPRGPFYKNEIVCKECLKELPNREGNDD